MMTETTGPSTLNRAALAVVAGLMVLIGLPVFEARAAEWKERTTRYTVIYHQPEMANTAEQLAGIVDPIVEQIGAIYDVMPRRPFAIRLHTTIETYSQTSDLARTSYGQVAQAVSQGPELALAEPRLRNLTPEQQRNLFRRGISQLVLDDLSRGRLPIGLLQGAAQYAEINPAEIEVGARQLDKARLDRQLLTWRDLNTPAKFIAQPEVAGAQSYAVAAFLFDRYGLAAWQRLLTALRNGSDVEAAMTQAYGKTATALEEEWHAYLAEYFASTHKINHFTRYDVSVARAHLQGGRYVEAGEELVMVAKFVAGAGRTAKETELKEVKVQIELGLEGGNLIAQGQSKMASFDYAGARETFLEARQRFDTLGDTGRIEETDRLIQLAESGVTALVNLGNAQRLRAELRYTEALGEAQAAARTFGDLGDEEHYRQSFAILQELSAAQLWVAYLLASAGLIFVAWSVWFLLAQARRTAIPGVLQ